MNRFSFSTAVLCALLATISCKKSLEDADLEETVQAAAEDLASIDEALTGGTREDEEDDRDDDRSGFCFTKPFSTCTAGVRTRDFDECSRILSGTTWDGIVRFTWGGPSASSCTLPPPATGTITRTFDQDLTITGRRGGVITVTDDVTTTHDGVSISGGQRLTTTGRGSYTWEVLGLNRKGVAGGVEIFNISRRTTSPIVMTGTSRADRQITSGTLQVFHNLAKFNTEWVVTKAIKWDATCYCPVEGIMTGTFTGTRTGTTVMTWNGCGSVTIEKEGKTIDINSDSCGAVSVRE